MPVPNSASETVEISEEELRVRKWRVKQLALAGYPAGLCLILADDADVDLHQAVGLLEHGCPVATAARILGWPL